MKSEMKNQKLKERINKAPSQKAVSNEKVKRKGKNSKEDQNRKLKRTTEPTTTKLRQQEFTLISKRNRQLSLNQRTEEKPDPSQKDPSQMRN